MAKEATKESVKKTSADDLEKKVQELEKQKAELQALLAEGDEGALKRVAKYAGVDPEAIVSKETTPVEELVEVEMGTHEVRINGEVFRGKVTVARSVAQVLNQAIGDRRMRLLRELTGSDHLVETLAGGAVRSRVVGQINELGEKIG